MISTRVLRYVDEVVREGSIRKAGDKLHVAPSAINRQIIALEQTLGTALFERLPRRMRPTAACEALVAHAREVMTAERRVMDEIDAMRDGQAVQCKIATVPGVASDLLSRALASHRRALPGVGFMVRVTTAEAVSAAVAANEVDVGFAFDLPRLTRTAVAASIRSPCGVLVAPGHPLADRVQVRLHDILAFPLLLPRSGVSVRNALDNAAWRAGVRLRPALESDDFHLLKQFTAFDDGVAVLNRADAFHATQEGRCVFLPLAEMAGFTQELSVMTCAQKRVSVATRGVIDRLAQVLKDLCDQAAA